MTVINIYAKLLKKLVKKILANSIQQYIKYNKTF